MLLSSASPVSSSYDRYRPQAAGWYASHRFAAEAALPFPTRPTAALTPATPGASSSSPSRGGGSEVGVGLPVPRGVAGSGVAGCWSVPSHVTTILQQSPNLLVIHRSALPSVDERGFITIESLCRDVILPYCAATSDDTTRPSAKGTSMTQHHPPPRGSTERPPSASTRGAGHVRRRSSSVSKSRPSSVPPTGTVDEEQQRVALLRSTTTNHTFAEWVHVLYRWCAVTIRASPLTPPALEGAADASPPAAGLGRNAAKQLAANPSGRATAAATAGGEVGGDASDVAATTAAAQAAFSYVDILTSVDTIFNGPTFRALTTKRCFDLCDVKRAGYLFRDVMRSLSGIIDHHMNETTSDEPEASAASALAAMTAVFDDDENNDDDADDGGEGGSDADDGSDSGRPPRVVTALESSSVVASDPTVPQTTDGVALPTTDGPDSAAGPPSQRGAPPGSSDNTVVAAHATPSTLRAGDDGLGSATTASVAPPGSAPKGPGSVTDLPPDSSGLGPQLLRQLCDLKPATFIARPLLGATARRLAASKMALPQDAEPIPGPATMVPRRHPPSSVDLAALPKRTTNERRGRLPPAAAVLPPALSHIIIKAVTRGFEHIAAAEIEKAMQQANSKKGKKKKKGAQAPLPLPSQRQFHMSPAEFGRFLASDPHMAAAFLPVVVRMPHPSASLAGGGGGTTA